MMTHKLQQEINLLEKICFDINYEDVDSKVIHNTLINTVTGTFMSLGYRFVTNKQIKFEKINPRTYEFLGKFDSESMDLLLFKNKIQIAVEVDRGSVLKLKSILKLVHSDSQLKIGVLFPKGKGCINDVETKNRILNVKKMKNLTTPILIINVYDKISYYV
jgi:hypothetical protein